MILSHRIWGASILAISLCWLEVGKGAEPTGELIFPLESWHNHGSCILETPDRQLVVCWFHGSGERTADDVRIEGARRRNGATNWSQRFTLADTLGYPDGNPCMFLDASNRLWLIHTVILANTWESALLKSRVSTNYEGEGPPVWSQAEVIHVTPGPEFDRAISNSLPRLEGWFRTAELDKRTRGEVADYLDAMRQHSTNKLYRRLGWMTRAHPVVLNTGRIVLPLYHDGFSFSLMALSDDNGQAWRTGSPLIGGGNIQPSVVRRRTGSLYALMRDNGPPPKRLQDATSQDDGVTWSLVADTDIPNPGSGTDLIGLRSGRWLFIGNDTEKGRHRLSVWMSEDEGRTWRWKRVLEETAPGEGSFHYPSVIQARDGSLHASYSYHMKTGGAIKHMKFDESWLEGR